MLKGTKGEEVPYIPFRPVYIVPLHIFFFGQETEGKKHVRRFSLLCLPLLLFLHKKKSFFFLYTLIAWSRWTLEWERNKPVIVTPLLESPWPYSHFVLGKKKGCGRIFRERKADIVRRPSTDRRLFGNVDILLHRFSSFPTNYYYCPRFGHFDRPSLCFSLTHFAAVIYYTQRRN